MRQSRLPDPLIEGRGRRKPEDVAINVDENPAADTPSEQPEVNLFGPYVQSLRSGLGIHQKQIAEMAGIPVAHLSKIERGVVRYPQAPTMRAIAMALNKCAKAFSKRTGETVDGFPIHPEELLARFARPSRTQT